MIAANPSHLWPQNKLLYKSHELPEGNNFSQLASSLNSYKDGDLKKKNIDLFPKHSIFQENLHSDRSSRYIKCTVVVSTTDSCTMTINN